MNGKERARTALRGGIPDRVPLGDFAIDFDTAERILGHETYHRAKARCQIAYWDGRRDEVVQGLIEDTIALYRALDVYDIVNLASMTLGFVPPKGYQPEKPRRIDDRTWEYADGRALKYSPLTGDITLVYDPDEWTRSIIAKDYPLTWDNAAPDPSVYELVDAVAAALPDRFIIGPFPTAGQWPQPGSMARTLTLMAEEPALYERIVQSSLAQAAMQQAHWRNPGIDGVLDGTDWASGKGTMMSPRMWRRYLYPALAANVRAVHDQGLLFVQHACGNNWGILDGFIEAGVDCYQSVQASAGMDLGAVKAHAAGRMAVWAGCASRTWSVARLMMCAPTCVRPWRLPKRAAGSSSAPLTASPWAPVTSALWRCWTSLSD